MSAQSRISGLAASCALSTLVLMGAALAGGDADGCCAGLEQRIEVLESELEEAGIGIGTDDTVSLEISGHVHRALLLWDDSSRRDVYINDPTNWGTFVEFKGEAEIEEGFEAGFLMSLEMPIGESVSLSQTDSTTPFGVIVGRAALFLSSDKLGRLSWGRETEAHDHVTEADLSGTGLFTGPGITDWNGSFTVDVLQRARLLEAPAWSDLTAASLGDGDNAMAVRYETPGETSPKLALSWGAGSVSAAALTGAAESKDFEAEWGLSLAHYGEDVRSPCIDRSPRANCLVAGGSVSLMHVPSGAGVSVAAGGILEDPRSVGDRDAWAYGKIFEKIDAVRFGETVFYAEHFRGRHSGELALAGSSGAVPSPGLAFSADVEMTGAGIMQSFDEAEMQAYAGWRTYRGDVDARFATGADPGRLSMPRFEAWLAGVRINF